jgi:flagellar basal-body rod protein FlgB
MNPLSSIAYSGLNAALLRMDAAANNIANVQTPGYRRQFVEQEALAEGGVAASVGQAQEATANLADDLVQQMVAAYSFKANLRTIQTQHVMLGSLLDVTA